MSRVQEYKFRIIEGGAEPMEHAVAIGGNSTATMNSAITKGREKQTDDLMLHLSKCGKRLNEALDFSEDTIDRALKELREECWK